MAGRFDDRLSVLPEDVLVLGAWLHMEARVIVSRPDPKPIARHVATRAEWERIVAAKDGPCRSCGGRRESFHHAVPRSLGGDDVEANIIPLCGSGTTGCHGIYETRQAGWEIVAAAIRHSLTTLEERYIVAKKGKWWLDKNLPHADTGLCARCKRTKASKAPAERRNRKRVVVTVPDDAENGAQILDVLVESCRDELKEPLGYRDDTPAYYIYTAVLADWLSSRAA